jgi:hypothetical protein
MKGCQQGLAVLAAIGLVVTGVLALFVVNLAQIVTDREVIKGAVDVEQILRQGGPEMILNGFQVPEEVEAFIPESVDFTAVQSAFDEVIPPDWLNQQGDEAIDTVYDFLETGQTSQGSTTKVDLRPVLQRLRAEPGRQLIEATLESLPPCADPQVAFDFTTLDLPDCRPTQVPVAQVTDLIHTAVVQTLEANAQLIEENAIITLPLFNPESLTPQQWQNLQRAHQLFVLAQDWAWLLWLPPLFCLLFILILTVRSMGELGYWWGWPLLITGGLSLFIAALLPAVFLAQIRLALPNTLGAMQPGTDRIVQELADRLVTLWLDQVYLQAGLLLGVGVVLVGIGFLLYGRASSRPSSTPSWS